MCLTTIAGPSTRALEKISPVSAFGSEGKAMCAGAVSGMTVINGLTGFALPADKAATYHR